MTKMTLSEMQDNYNTNVIALTLHLAREENNQLFELEKNIQKEYLDYSQKMVDDGDYLSLTDEEADDRRVEYVENSMDDMASELVGKYWQMRTTISGGVVSTTREIEDHDRGGSLASYDWYEHDETVDNTTYYIYRCN